MAGREVIVSTPGLTQSLQAAPQDGPLTPENIIRIAARYLPENTIICDESLSAHWPYPNLAHDGRFHDYLWQAAGPESSMLSISLGVAIASPGRKVLCLVAAGSAMDNLLALRIIARGNLDITMVMYSQAAENVSARWHWQTVAAEIGLEATRVVTLADFNQHFSIAMGRKGAFLVEAVL